MILAALLTFAPLEFTGVNLAGAEFGEGREGKPRVFDKDYTYPTESEVAYFASKGMNVFRIPFRWEAMQPRLKAELVQEELSRLKKLVAAVTGRRLIAILDPHNYARWYGSVIGGQKVQNADFADFWARMAKEFRADPGVWFGLMNEPHDMHTQQWLDAANAAILAIRKTGAKNKILVPGSHWSGAHSWISSGNTLMLNVKDRVGNFAYDVHQYLDTDSSGTKPMIVSPTIGSERLKSFTEWCRLHKRRAFLGEFGVDASSDAQVAVSDMLSYMERNRDVWLGFTWWAAGPWWGDYMFSIEPKDGKDRPQLAFLKPHLQK